MVISSVSLNKPSFDSSNQKKSNRNQPFNTNNKIYFGQGEVKFWTDFDGTLFPVDEDKLNNKRTIRKLKKYFQDFASFFENSQGKAECNITTGRNFISFYSIFNQLKQHGIKLFEPDKLVTSNGGDLFIKSRQNNTTVDYKNVDPAKREEIKNITNWDGDHIRELIIQLFKELDVPLCQPLNVNPDVKKILFPVLRNDGNLQICIDIPEDMLNTGIVETISAKLKQTLDEKDIKYQYTFEDYDPVYHRGPCIILVPDLIDTTLSKAYDVKQALKKASEEDDLVIVAGDYNNDYQMLNPETYVSKPEDIKDLPLISIVVGKNKKLGDLAEKYPDKVLVTDEFKLLETIKKAIKDFALSHPEFKLKPELKDLTGINLKA
jgi:hydroxymethylpyrimidine pyrophosphatase-like HAD family hydrolase